MSPSGFPGVCFVTDRTAAAGRPLEEIVAGALAGGASMIQVREKDLAAAALFRLTASVVAAARSTGSGKARVLVNDRLDVALASKAAGVHLPGTGLPVDGVRRQAGKRFLVGRSIHTLAEGKAAAQAGSDFVFFGPVFATPSKAAFGEPQGIDALRKVAEGCRIPVWAIGGITPETAATLRGIPIAGVAAIGAIASSPDPAEAVRALRRALGDDLV